MKHYNTNACFFQYTFANNLYKYLHIVILCINNTRIWLYGILFMCLFV